MEQLGQPLFCCCLALFYRKRRSNNRRKGLVFNLPLIFSLTAERQSFSHDPAFIHFSFIYFFPSLRLISLLACLFIQLSSVKDIGYPNIYLSVHEHRLP